MTTKYSNMAEYFDYRGRRFAEKCTNCGECLEVCPLFPLTRFAHKGPQAIIEKITDLLKGGEVSEEAYDMLCSCSGACGLCAKACPEKLMPYSAFMSALVKTHKAGRKAPPLNYQYMPGHRYNFAHVFSALQVKPSETRWIKKIPDNPDPVDVVFCTGCHLTCLGTLPRFMSVPFQSYELSQFLVENLDRIPFERRIDKVVTMHDSCSVARLGTFELPRQLLRAIPGITLVEMEHNRDDALCCGGTANTMRPEITGPMRRAPLEEAKATGAEIMATSCTGCIVSFTPLEDGYPFEVRSYINLVAEAVGVPHEDKFRKYAKSRDAAKVIAEAHDYIAASDFTPEELKRILPDYLDRFCPKHGR